MKKISKASLYPSKKVRVGVMFGGKSGEHEVSIESAKNVVNSLDKVKYDVVLIGIDKDGKWYVSSGMLPSSSFKTSGDKVALLSGSNRRDLVKISGHETVGALDVIFPVLHGPNGEDGTVQGLLKLSGIPYVGAGVLGSAVGMDKDVMKRLLRDAKIPVAKFLVFKQGEKHEFEHIKKELGLPFFVKPANLGSSVGVSKVHSKEEFETALSEAFRFDNKILIEEFINGREIECSVLGNEEPIASIPGEVKSNHEFYSYEAKYIDEKGAELLIPAKLSDKTKRKIRNLAIKTFKVLCCEGMARVDFFLKGNKVYVNEINTIPGFTKISMYPKLWEASGVSYTELIDRLIQLAIQRFEKESKLKVSRI